MPIYFSHTDRSLNEHLNGLNEVIKNIIVDKTQSYWTKEYLGVILKRLIAFHDIAKATPYFQFRISEATKEENYVYFESNKDEFNDWLKHPQIKGLNYSEIKKLSRHTLFGATVSQQCFSEDELCVFHLILFEIINRHHGDLSDFSSYNFTKAFSEDEEKDFLMQFQTIDFNYYFVIVSDLIGITFPQIEFLKERFGRQRKINQILIAIEKERSVSYFLQTLFLYSLLLSADKGDVMLHEKEKILKRSVIPSNIIDKFKKNIPKGKPIDDLREIAYHTVQANLENNLEANFFNITLPTGLGKTFTAYKAALRLKEKFPKHRIVYCLPFTSIIDQNGQLLKTILKKTGQNEHLATLHHYLSTPHEKTNDEDILNYQEADYLTEGWENEFIITTFVQLFESIFTNRNKSLRKFHNLANSIIILDEVQNVPPKFIEVIEVIFSEMSEKFNTKFLFVTATQPIILEDKIVPLAEKTNEPKSYFFDKLNRITLDQALFKNGVISNNDFIEEVKKTIKAKPGKSILIIVNTKAFSQEIFEQLNNKIPLECLYLSASLIPYHRKKIIDNVKNSVNPMCLISTQVVEAGVDIDFDIVYREFAPMDSINQAAGRCNRNGVKGKGVVKIFKRETKVSIYDSTLMSKTNEVLSKRNANITEPEIFDINNEYFKKIKESAQKDSNQSADLLKHIYGLQFEKIKKSFKLIDKPYKEHDFFIQVTDEASQVWEKYIDSMNIENNFERKAAIKKIKPQLLNYVVSIPDYLIEVEDEELEKPIIKRNNWNQFYDEVIGVKINRNNSKSKSTHFL